MRSVTDVSESSEIIANSRDEFNARGEIGQNRQLQAIL
jgi:hypothetical protein